MRSNPFFLLVPGVVLAQKILTNRQSASSSAYGAIENYFAAVCMPWISEGHPDFNAPCRQLQLIEEQCSYGPEASWNQTANSNSTTYGIIPSLSPRDQQLCICNGQVWQAFDGCSACANKHGIPDLPESEPDIISSFSASYCVASKTATVNWFDALNSVRRSHSYSYLSTVPTTFTDPIGSKTDVSLYFTPSITASRLDAGATSALSIVHTTASSSDTASVSASVSVQTTASSSPAITGATTTSASTHIQATGAAVVGATLDRMIVAGVVGLAAVVAGM